jgi:isopenicillin N synthase-like dioxygenase
MSSKAIPAAVYDGDLDEFVQTFGRSIEEFGFARIVGHPIDTALLQRSYDVCQRLFDLPIETKMRHDRPDIGRRIGYGPHGCETAVGKKVPDRKEFWHVRAGRFGDDSQFPPEIPDFKEVAMALYDQELVFAKHLLNALAWYYGMPSDRLSEMVEGGDSLERWLHYWEAPPGDPAMPGDAHEDINFITLLPAATASGLEVMTKDGEWLPIDNGPGEYIINSGDMLKKLTENDVRKFPSTTHRVMPTFRGKRYSKPFFIHPRGDVELAPGLIADQALQARLIKIGNDKK